MNKFIASHAHPTSAARGVMCLLVVGLSLVLMLPACTLVPGMSMSHLLLQPASLPGWPAEPAPQPSTTEITSALVDTLAKENTATNGSTPSLADSAPQVYRLGAGDLLSITVWDHPELNIANSHSEVQHPSEIGHVIGPDGLVFFPYAGQIQAKGRSVEQFREALTEALSKQLKDPQVSVQVMQFRSQRVMVGGEVHTPGTRALGELPLRLLDAIDGAGGTTDNADLEHVELRRGDHAYRIDLRAFYATGENSQNPLLQDGDIINLASVEANQVFVLGEVPHPGVQQVGDRSVSLTEALATAGGIDQTTAAAGGIYVVRSDEQARRIFHLDASSADALALADRFTLRPRDVVFVDATGLTRWNRFVSQILPSSTTLQNASSTDFPLFHGHEREIRR